MEDPDVAISVHRCDSRRPAFWTIVGAVSSVVAVPKSGYSSVVDVEVSATFPILCSGVSCCLTPLSRIFHLYRGVVNKSPKG